MKNFLLVFSRLFVGILFIFSGLIKLNDPTGFAYKLEEYFGVFNMYFLMPYALYIGLFLLFLEVILGVLLLIGFKSKPTVISLLIIIVFFTFLTLYSAVTNKVTDCGCFGDALPLTPWQSFYKDLVLLAFILILFVWHKSIKPLFCTKISNIITILALGLCIAMAYQVINHLPFKDFRAYKVGTNIQEGMSIPEDAPRTEIEMIFVYDVNGVPTEYTMEQIMLGDYPDDAEMIERKEKVIKQGYIPPIKDFTMIMNDMDYTEAYLDEPKVVMITSYDLSKANEKGLSKLKDLFEKASQEGYEVMGLTGTTGETIDQIKQKYDLGFDFFFCDPTAVKTIERANPSIVILNNGTIVQKVHYNDIHKIKW